MVRLTRRRAHRRHTVRRALLAFVVAALAAAGCTNGGPTSAERPDDGDLDPADAPDATPAPPPTPTPSTTDYAVAAGDTLGAIADRFGVTVDEILEVNDITIDTVLNIGDRLNIPVPPPPVTEEEVATGDDAAPTILTEYAVESGDTLGSIATQFGLAPEELAELNSITVDTPLQVGQILQVPVAASDAETSPEGPVAAPGNNPVNVGDYTVVSGDTLGGIAARLGVPLDALLEANGLTADSPIQVGDVLTVPEL